MNTNPALKVLLHTGSEFVILYFGENVIEPDLLELQNKLKGLYSTWDLYRKDKLLCGCVFLATSQYTLTKL